MHAGKIPLDLVPAPSKRRGGKAAKGDRSRAARVAASKAAAKVKAVNEEPADTGAEGDE